MTETTERPLVAAINVAGPTLPDVLAWRYLGWLYAEARKLSAELMPESPDLWRPFTTGDAAVNRFSDGPEPAAARAARVLAAAGVNTGVGEWA